MRNLDNCFPLFLFYCMVLWLFLLFTLAKYNVCPWPEFLLNADSCNVFWYCLYVLITNHSCCWSQKVKTRFFTSVKICYPPIWQSILIFIRINYSMYCVIIKKITELEYKDFILLMRTVTDIRSIFSLLCLSIQWKGEARMWGTWSLWMYVGIFGWYAFFRWKFSYALQLLLWSSETWWSTITSSSCSSTNSLASIPSAMGLSLRGSSWRAWSSI